MLYISESFHMELGQVANVTSVVTRKTKALSSDVKDKAGAPSSTVKSKLSSSAEQQPKPQPMICPACEDAILDSSKNTCGHNAIICDSDHQKLTLCWVVVERFQPSLNRRTHSTIPSIIWSVKSWLWTLWNWLWFLWKLIWLQLQTNFSKTRADPVLIFPIHCLMNFHLIYL